MTFEKQPGLWPRWDVKKDDRLCGRIHRSEGLGIVFHGNFNGPPMTPEDLRELAEFMKGQKQTKEE